jgi:hypothetical protein
MPTWVCNHYLGVQHAGARRVEFSTRSSLKTKLFSQSTKGLRIAQMLNSSRATIIRARFATSSVEKFDPFLPDPQDIRASSPAASSQRIALPAIHELLDASFLDRLIPPQQPEARRPGILHHAMMDALKDVSNRMLTANFSPAFKSTNSPTLDAFSSLGPQTSGEDVHSLLTASWAEDQELTLRIIWNLRSIHDGKAEKMVFYRAFGWLYRHHPRTAIANLRMLIEFVIERPKKRKKAPEGEEIATTSSLVDAE